LHNDIFSADSFSVRDSEPDDEIDALFGQLEQIQPPASLAEDILASVARLHSPMTSTYITKGQSLLEGGEHTDELIVYCKQPA